jgi:hypothetical protein
MMKEMADVIDEDLLRLLRLCRRFYDPLGTLWRARAPPSYDNVP